jgi:hypothetical protein
MKNIHVLPVALLGLGGLLTLPACSAEPRQAAASEPSFNEGLDVLASLPYAQAVTTSRMDEGVVHADPDAASPGLNLYTPGPNPEILLAANDGTIVHRWRVTGSQLGAVSWHHAALVPGSDDIIAMQFENGLARIGWDGTVRWHARSRVHHELHFTSSGELYTVRNTREEIEHRGRMLPVLSDNVTVYDLDGNVKRDIRLFPILADRIPESQLDDVARRVDAGFHEPAIEQPFRYQTTPFDVFHTNSVQPLERDLPGVASAGDLLVCVRQMDLIAILDPEAGEIVWELEGIEVEEPHQPQLLANGHILLFDNGTHRGNSRVLEIDPRTHEVVWSYGDDPDQFFFSDKRGGCQRLPNGNTLITESERGRTFEVTPAGDVVWIHLQPKVAHDKRAVVYRMHRVERSEVPCLAEARTGSR